MFTASKSYFYQNSGRIHCKCVLHIQKYSQNIRHIYYNIAKCSTYEKMPSFSYTIQFIVYVPHEFKFITNMFFFYKITRSAMGWQCLAKLCTSVTQQKQHLSSGGRTPVQTHIAIVYNHKNNSTCTLCTAYNRIIFPQTYLNVKASIYTIFNTQF